LPSGVIGARLAAYSCGGSHGIGGKAAPCSLLIPEGNHHGQARTIEVGKSSPDLIGPRLNLFENTRKADKAVFRWLRHRCGVFRPRRGGGKHDAN
jgi:hypothetical protein